MGTKSSAGRASGSSYRGDGDGGNSYSFVGGDSVRLTSETGRGIGANEGGTTAWSWRRSWDRPNGKRKSGIVVGELSKSKVGQVWLR